MRCIHSKYTKHKVKTTLNIELDVLIRTQFKLYRSICKEIPFGHHHHHYPEHDHATTLSNLHSRSATRFFLRKRYSKGISRCKRVRPNRRTVGYSMDMDIMMPMGFEHKMNEPTEWTAHSILWFFMFNFLLKHFPFRAMRLRLALNKPPYFLTTPKPAHITYYDVQHSNTPLGTCKTHSVLQWLWLHTFVGHTQIFTRNKYRSSVER